MSPLTIYPAIDLRGGRVVRLLHGHPASQTVYENDPARVARHWIGQGAGWLHVINLSAAFSEPGDENRTALKKIVNAASQSNPGVKIQYGGGLRTLQQVESILSMGVSRVILGTLATSLDLVENAVRRFGAQAITGAIDVRERKVRVRGWLEDTGLDPVGFGQDLRARGIQTVIYTNISRDGAETGLDIAGALTLCQQTGLEVIAAGGVNSIADVQEVRSAGLSGVVIGRALYEGNFTLEEALAC
ncbi:MAG TPA: 1-(5-phosphoribosyl)-5-[(5-phosphoribosylamino)methylideneamino] imidazole-4-carboxamide isomerase [Anaerolineales bacterium]|jgi:phosphoribosylformimino-5-aminoimidazole carboxamide ribotide isomerase|nr:1-(5-phosphoribosyl)-5-[(5-phosphoribosylamino)methylideneamino] imidazole-4-carboxamide isomerase [Anaerolineales bacterium]